MKKKTFWIDNPLYQIGYFFILSFGAIMIFSFIYLLIEGIQGKMAIPLVIFTNIFALIMATGSIYIFLMFENMVVHMDSTHIWMNNNLSFRKK